MKTRLQLAAALLCALAAAAAAGDGGAAAFFRLAEGSSAERLAGALPGVTISRVMGNVYAAEGTDYREDARGLADRLAAFSEVLAAQPRAYGYPPPETGERTGADKGWFLEKIRAPLFWRRSAGSRSVRVLVCDTGVDPRHPDLAGNVGRGVNFVDGSANTEPTGNGHGTRIAGLIGAHGGATGLNKEVTIIPGKITNKTDGATDHADSAKCIKWGADQGIKVVNLSISNAAASLPVQEAADYLYSKGGVLVVSAGNAGQHLDLPDHPHMIAVGATNDYDWHPPAYNTGWYVDLSAPASSLYTTDLGGGYITSNGTSLSAAIVSGAAALMLSVKPGLSAAELAELLAGSTVDLGAPGRDDIFGAGRLDLGKALELLGP